MNPADALRIIRERAADSGCVVILPHARDRMVERKIDRLEILRVLRAGAITDGPWVDARSDNERCRLEGQVDGEWIGVVVEIPENRPDLLVVTVIDLDR